MPVKARFLRCRAALITARLRGECTSTAEESVFLDEFRRRSRSPNDRLRNQTRVHERLSTIPEWSGLPDPRSSERGQLPTELPSIKTSLTPLSVSGYRKYTTKRCKSGKGLSTCAVAREERSQSLAANNIIELKFSFGALVRRPSPEDARNVYQARRFLEAGVIQSIAEDPEAYNLWRDYANSCCREESLSQSKTSSSSEFHIIVAEVIGNQAFREILVRLIHHCCLIQSFYVPPAGQPCLVHDHEELITLQMAMLEGLCEFITDTSSNGTRRGSTNDYLQSQNGVI